VTRAARQLEDGPPDVLDGRVDVVDRGRQRVVTSGRSASRLAFSSVRPIANSRWITRSCRSGPIRSRSSNTASREPVLPALGDLHREGGLIGVRLDQPDVGVQEGLLGGRRPADDQHAVPSDAGAQRDQHQRPGRPAEQLERGQLVVGHVRQHDRRGRPVDVPEVRSGCLEVGADQVVLRQPGDGDHLHAVVVRGHQHRRGVRAGTSRARRATSVSAAEPSVSVSSAELTSAAASNQRRRKVVSSNSRAFSITTPAAGREGHHDVLVLDGERAAAPLLGEVEVAEHLVPDPDRDAEEGLHRGVVGRESVRRRVLAEDGQPQRLGPVDDETEDPVAGRQVADGGPLVGGEPVGHELAQPPTGTAAEHAQRAELRVGERARGGDDALQRTLQRQVGVDADDGVEQAAEAFLRVQHAGDPGQHLAQQLVQPGTGQRRLLRRPDRRHPLASTTSRLDGRAKRPTTPAPDHRQRLASDPWAPRQV
jgi:hypothetical protein